MGEFKIPPVSTLIGGTGGNFFRTLRGNFVEPQHYLKVFLSGLIIALTWPFRVYERLWFKNKIKKFKHKKDPIFLIGHWRSGTTFLHSVLCKANNASYLTTYFSVFPVYTKSKWLFLPFMNATMPEKRPTDNVKLKAAAPQEDEFALSCLTPYSYYNFWRFPNRSKEFYDNYVRFENLEIKEQWKNSYSYLLKKANLNIKGSQLIIKNPVNTARIPALLEMYPNAKFIYLCRNPLSVYLSSLKFFTEVLNTICFHSLSKDSLDKLILNTYVKLIHDYERDKSLIPKQNLVEIKFEDLEANPLRTLETIYSELGLTTFDEDKDQFTTYLNSLRGYKKNEYEASPEIIEKVKRNWGFAFEMYGYNLPTKGKSRPPLKPSRAKQKV